jgi:F-type H+-transporting ATPase subunit delta
MASTRAAIRYAKAILEIAESKEWLLVSDMNLIASTIGGNLELSTFIQNPTLREKLRRMLY